MVIVGVDTGGTFTDFVAVVNGELRVHKEHSTPEDPAKAILKGLKVLEVAGQVSVLVHGTTVATNALLERKGVRTGLLTTAGFRDVLEIGRQNRPKLYDLWQVKDPPIVPREWRLEVRERLDERGTVLIPLEEADIERAIGEFHAAGLESVAVCFLFSFANPVHEVLAAERLRKAGFFVSASHEILPEYREYERTVTTVVNAYIAPIVGRYLERLVAGLPSTTILRVMQSNGGVVSAKTAARQAVRTVLSGPAGGVVGARAVAQRAGIARLISFDMGGTSTDVCLIDGEPQERSEGQIGPYPVRLPMLDIHTVGAGGGSLAWFDRGGALRVGPRSAGAQPGPACYGRGGEEATVTDAAVVIGWIPFDSFLGGQMELDRERAAFAVEKVARELGWRREGAALGILEVAQATMEGAIRVITVERGHDPREFTLVAFGGAGPVVACELATRLYIPRVLIPRYPGVLSALGLVMADQVRDYLRTVMCSADDEARVRQVLAELEFEATRDLTDEALPPTAARFEAALDLRYSGQSYELTVPFSGELSQSRATFQALHRQRYGFALSGEPVVVVNVRLRTILPCQSIALGQQERLVFWEPEPEGEWQVAFRRDGEAKRFTVPRYRRDNLTAGALLVGPALITQYDTTVVIPPGWRGFVDELGTLILEQRGAQTVELGQRGWYGSSS